MIFNIDFDGTVVTHEFPNTGKNIGAEFVLKKLIENGHQLIIFTMRCDHDFEPTSDQPEIHAQGGPYLTDAINWFKTHNIPLWGIQTNPEQYKWTSSPKSYAQVMIDDSALGVPLLSIPEISSRPFVDWCEVAWILYKINAISLSQYEQVWTNIQDCFSYGHGIKLKEEYEYKY